MNNSLFQKFLSKMDQTLISQSEKSRKFSKNKIEKSVPLVKKPAGIVIRKNLPFAFEIMHIFKFFFLALGRNFNDRKYKSRTGEYKQ